MINLWKIADLNLLSEYHKEIVDNHEMLINLRNNEIENILNTIMCIRVDNMIKGKLDELGKQS